MLKLNRMKPIFMMSLLVLMFIMTACGGGGDGAGEVIAGIGSEAPQDAVEGFLEAVFSADTTRAATFVCNAQRELMRGVYAEMTAAYAALDEFDVDLSELIYTVVSEEDVDATVSITGDVVVRIAGVEGERRINLDERFASVKLKKEDDLWRVC